MTNNQHIQAHIGALEAQITALQMTVNALKATMSPQTMVVQPIVDTTIGLSNKPNWNLPNFNPQLDISNDNGRSLDQGLVKELQSAEPVKSPEDNMSAEQFAKYSTFAAIILRELIPTPLPDLNILFQQQQKGAFELFENLEKNFTRLGFQEYNKTGSESRAWDDRCYIQAYGSFFADTTYAVIEPATRAYMGYFLAHPPIRDILVTENNGMPVDTLFGRTQIFVMVVRKILSLMADQSAKKPAPKPSNIGDSFFSDLAISFNVQVKEPIQFKEYFSYENADLGTYTGMMHLYNRLKALDHQDLERYWGSNPMTNDPKTWEPKLHSLYWPASGQPSSEMKGVLVQYLLSDRLVRLLDKYSAIFNGPMPVVSVIDRLQFLTWLLAGALGKVQKLG